MNPIAARPRLVLTNDRLAKLRAAAGRDPKLAKLVAMQVELAQDLLELPPAERKMDGPRLLFVSREVLRRVTTLAFVSRWTGDERFTRRAVEEMLAVAAFEDWGPMHFLDVAEMAAGVAFGFDWLYDQLSPDERMIIRQSLHDKALVPGRLGIEPTPWWQDVDTNWSQVCWTGMTLVALAVWEDEPEQAKAMVEHAVERVRSRPMPTYEPDGAYPEGPGYWKYGTMFNVLLIEGLETASGRRFGPDVTPCFHALGPLRQPHEGPTQEPFPYMDSFETDANDIRFWFAHRCGDLDEPIRQRTLDRYTERDARTNRLGGVAMAWLHEDAPADASPLPLGYVAAGITPVAAFRTSWTDENGSWIALKGGSASANHGHMDVGSFRLRIRRRPLGRRSRQRAVPRGRVGRHRTVRTWRKAATGGASSGSGFASHNLLTHRRQPPRVQGSPPFERGEARSATSISASVYGGKVAGVDPHCRPDRRPPRRLRRRPLRPLHQTARSRGR